MPDDDDYEDDDDDDDDDDVFIRYKDGEVLPVEERGDVLVTMTRLENKVVSVLNIKNLSDQK